MPVGPVKLRIVGLFFNTTVSLEIPADGVSIKDVLEAYIAGHPFNKKGGLKYTLQTEGGDPLDATMLTIAHNYGGKYDFNGDGNIVAAEGPTLSGGIRSKGVYELTEIPLPYGNGVVAWQYYVEDENGVKVSSTDVPAAFVSFQKFKVKANYTITWRQVAILRGPNTPAPTA
jgi:hypothetical protein